MKSTLSRLAVLAAAVLAIPASVSADLVVTLQPTTQTLNVGSSGFFDVFVTGTSTTADPVSGYAITLLGASGISYTNATTETAATNSYIFPTAQGLDVQATGSEMVYIDQTAADPTNITTTETYGAGRIFFDAVAPGTYTINFDSDQSGFFDEGQFLIPTTYTGATITVLPAAVPEPSTTILLGLTGIAGLVVTRLRRKSPGTGT